MFDVVASSKLLEALANEKRLVMVKVLCDRELSVNEICQTVGLEQSAVSQHLRILRLGGFVSYRKEAQKVFYRCESEAVLKMLSILGQLFVE